MDWESLRYCSTEKNPHAPHWCETIHEGSTQDRATIDLGNMMDCPKLSVSSQGRCADISFYTYLSNHSSKCGLLRGARAEVLLILPSCFCLAKHKQAKFRSVFAWHKQITLWVRWYIEAILLAWQPTVSICWFRKGKQRHNIFAQLENVGCFFSLSTENGEVRL